MDINSYTDERLLNTIKQSYNFDSEIVEAAKELALKRGLMSSVELDNILENNELIRFERKIDLNNDLENIFKRKEKVEKTNKRKRTLLNWLSVLVALVCFYLWSITGIGWFLVLPLFSFFTAKTVSNRYFKRTINK